MIARTAPCFANGGEKIGQHYYAVLGEPTPHFSFYFCLSVYLPSSGGAPIIDCCHVPVQRLDEAHPCTEGRFLAAYLDAQQSLGLLLTAARAFGLNSPTPAKPTHLVTTVEAVNLTDEERPAYNPQVYPF